MFKYKKYVAVFMAAVSLSSGLASVAVPNNVVQAAPLSEVNQQLFYAAGRGNLDAVKDALDNGADIDVIGIMGNTPLMCAAKLGHEEVAKFLVSMGADLNARAEDGTTLLYYAIVKDKKLAKFLIDAGVDINAKDNEGRTPLFSAIEGRGEIVRWLIEAGADLDVQYHGMTLLHLASYSRNEEVAKLLIDGGANLEIKNPQGQTALAHVTGVFLIIKDDKLKNIGNWLIAAGAKIDKRTASLIENGTYDKPEENQKPINAMKKKWNNVKNQQNNNNNQ